MIIGFFFFFFARSLFYITAIRRGIYGRIANFGLPLSVRTARRSYELYARLGNNNIIVGETTTRALTCARGEGRRNKSADGG